WFFHTQLGADAHRDGSCVDYRGLPQRPVRCPYVED
ncbi:MAG: hypothetical protein ACI9VX_002481, partial [Dinoroseobacter sp.]